MFFRSNTKMNFKLIPESILIFYIIFLPFTISDPNSKLIARVETPHEELLQCVVSLSNEVNHFYSLLVTAIKFESFYIHDINNTKIVINVKNKLKLISKFIAFYRVIMILDTTDQFEGWIKQLKLLRSWDPRGRFIVAILNTTSRDDIARIFEVAWGYYVVNIDVIILQTIGEKVINVYTYFPYNATNCTANLSPTLLFTCEGYKTANQIFPEKSPSDFQGCEVKMMAFTFAPFVINHTGVKTKAKTAGQEVVLIHELERMLKFKIKYIPQNYSDWGWRSSGRKYSNMYNDTLYRNIDLFYGKVPFNSEYFDDFDNSIPYFIDILHWWVPAAKQIPKWQNSFKLYRPMVWGLIHIILVLNSLLWFVFSKAAAEPEQLYKHFSGVFLIVWQTLAQNAAKFPLSNSMRVLYITWTFFCLLWCCIFQSKLTSVLTRPKYEHQISNVQELLKSKLKYGFPAEMSRYFADPNDMNQKTILNNFIPCPSMDVCVNRTAFQKDFASFRNRRQTLYLMKKYFLNQYGRPMIYGFKEGILTFPHIVMLRGYPFYDHLNFGILRLCDTGFVSKWSKDVESSYTFDVDLKNKLTPLSIDNYVLALMTYGFCITCSSLCFIYEVCSASKCIKKLKKNKK